MLCVLILYISSEPYILQASLDNRFYEKVLMATFLLLEFLLDICWEEVAEGISFFFNMADLGFEPRSHVY